jgi:hypothetical protein
MRASTSASASISLRAPAFGAVAEQTLELAQRLPALRLGFGSDQIGQALDRGEVELAVLECAAGELTRLRRAQTFDPRRAPPAPRRSPRGRRAPAARPRPRRSRCWARETTARAPRRWSRPKPDRAAAPAPPVAVSGCARSEPQAPRLHAARKSAPPQSPPEDVRTIERRWWRAQMTYRKHLARIDPRRNPAGPTASLPTDVTRIRPRTDCRKRHAPHTAGSTAAVRAKARHRTVAPIPLARSYRKTGTIAPIQRKKARRRRRAFKPPRPRDQPLSAPAPRQPGPLVALGARGAGQRRSERQTSRSCCRSATPPATGATSWRTKASRTRTAR